MTSVEDRYYNCNRTLLKTLGLWPYQDSKSACVRAAFVTIMYLSALFVQLAVFITHEFTMDIVLKVLSFAFPTIFLLYVYQGYYFLSDQMKGIMEIINYDWKSLKNKAELGIMEEYGLTAKQFSEISWLCLCTGILLALMCHILPITLDIVSPANVSRAQHLHILAEYFVDPSKYYYLLRLHMMIFVSIGMTTAISIGVALYCHALHTCAMLKVTNYRMRIIMDKNVMRMVSPERENVIYERIVYAVNIHRQALLYNKRFISCMDKSFLIMISIGVVSLSINLFRLLNAVVAFNEIVEMFIPTALLFFHFCYLFFGNHIGQQITNGNAEIFDTIYNLPWYIAPLNMQKLLLFLLQNGTNNIYLNVGGIFQTSYEGFASLTKLSLSYFTVLYSIQ